MKIRFTAFEDRLLRTFRLLANVRQGLRREPEDPGQGPCTCSSRVKESFLLPNQVVYAFQPQEQMRANLYSSGRTSFGASPRSSSPSRTRTSR